MSYVLDHEIAGAKLLTEQFRRKLAVVALLKSWLGQVQLLEDQIEQLQVQRSLSTATGVNLDLLGAIVGQPRGGRDDSQYRIWIAGRVLVNKSRGKTPQVIAIAAKLCGGDVELFEYQPATFIIRSHVPVAGNDGVEIAKLLKLAKAAGIAMQFVWFDVSTAFRFSPSGESQFSSAHGFGAGRLAAVSDGRDMNFSAPPPPDEEEEFDGSLLVVL